MANIDIRILDEKNDTQLDGAAFTLLDANKKQVLQVENVCGIAHIRDKEFIDSLGRGSIDGISLIAVDSLPAGLYTIQESIAPVFDTEAEGDDGERLVYRRSYKIALPKLIMIEDEPNAIATFDLRHESIGDGEIVTLDEDAITHPSRINKLLGYLQHPQILMAGAKRPFNRTHELTSTELSIVSWSALIVICAVIALYMWLIAPAIGVFIASCISIPQEGFGFGFFGANMRGYFSRYALQGWHAFALLKTAYPSIMPTLPVLILAIGGGLFGIVALVLRWFAARLKPKNPILDELPPAAGHGEKGTGKLITGREDVESTFGVLAGDSMQVKDPGIYIGFYGKAPLLQIADSIRSDIGHLIDKRATKDSTPPTPQSTFLHPKPYGEYVYIPGDVHTIIFGDTRAGKTRRLLLATLDLIHRSPTESSIIFDPKGELYGLCSEALKERGVECVRVDFRNPGYASRWNMVTLGIDAWARGETSKAVQLVSEVVSDIAPVQGNEGTSKYFNDGARAYIRSMLLYLIATDKCPRNQKTLTTVSRMIEIYGSAQRVEPSNPKNMATFVPYEEMLEMLPVDHPAAEAFSAARGANDKERKAFCSTAQTMLALFRDPALAAMTADTDNPFINVATKRQAVFLIVPDNKLAYAPFATMYLKQAYSTLADIATEGVPAAQSTEQGEDPLRQSRISGRLPQRVTIVCEELCSIPEWENLDVAINIAAGRGIRFILVAQQKSLFEAKYKDTAGGIIGNCGNKIFIKTGDVENTARWLSEYLGDYTINVSSTTLSGGRFSPFMLRKTVSTSPDKRRVMFADEVARWKADYGSIVLAGDRPCVVPLPDVSRIPTQHLFDLGSAAHNLEKIYKAMFATPPAPEVHIEKWYPELDKVASGKRYSDKERRQARAAYMTKLANASKARARRGNVQINSESMQGVLYNPATGESTIYSSPTDYIKAALSPKYEQWAHFEATSLQDIEAWIKTQKSKPLQAPPAKKGKRPDQNQLFEIGRLTFEEVFED